ncbi:MAG: ribosome biogenesis GTPase Der [Anaerolineae bacterium]
MPKAIVALVGRPNVGKSTLFNRIVGRRQAIVEDIPGTTRDRIYAEAEWAGVDFVVVDTGGLEVIPAAATSPDWQPLATASAPYVPAMRAQAEIAVREADVVIFVVDAMAGLTTADEAVADILRRSEKPIILAANKADNQELRQAATEFYALGLGEPMPISALHGSGTGDMLDNVVALLRQHPASEEAELPGVHLAIVGRPNVGKSSLLNSVLGEERAIVSDIPGTTRDAIDTQVTWQGQPVVLIDTAGIRRRGHIEQGLEQYSVLRALKAIERADVAILVLDATQMVMAQDAHIAGYILEARKSVVVAINKWDLVAGRVGAKDEYHREVRRELRFLDYVPIEFVSAKTGEGITRLLNTALAVYGQRQQHLTTTELNRIIRDAAPKVNPPSKAGKRLRVYYATQARTAPPTFVLFVNDRRLAHFGYTRFIENQIRERYPFTGTPIQIEYRDDKSKND